MKASRAIVALLLLLPIHAFPPGDAAAEADAPPTLAIATPESGAGVSRTVRVAGLAYDNDTGVADVQLRVDDGPWQSAALGARGRAVSAWNLALALTSGAHVIEARATDGVRVSASRFTTILANDPTPPGVFVESPLDGAGVDGRAPLRLVGRVAPVAPDVEVRWRVDDGPWHAASIAGAVWTASIPFLDPGVRTLTIVASAPDLGSSLPATVVVAAGDGTPAPEVRIATPVDGSGLSAEGETGCAPAPCATIAGFARETREIALSIDEGPPVSLPVGPDGTWRTSWPLTHVFEGDHLVVAAVDGGVPDRRIVRVGTPHALSAKLDPLVAPTGTAIQATVEAPGPLASVEWLVDGEPAATGSSATFALATPGFHLVVVRGRDSEDNVGVAMRWLLALNRPPVAIPNLIDLPPGAGVPIGFDGQASWDPDGHVVGWSWRLGREAPWGDFVGDPVTRLAFPKRGLHEVGLVVRDDQGALSAPTTFEVQVPNAVPVAAFAADRTVGTSLDFIRFTDLSTDGDGPSDVASWSWSFGDGTSSRERSPSHRFPRGRFDVALTVTDALGASATAVKSLTIANIAPEAAFDVSPPKPLATDATLFRDASEKPDGAIVAWHWDFGDGNESREPVAHHAYARAGLYRVRLAVTDDRGATSLAEREVSVTNHPPIVSTAAHPESADALASVTFMALDRDPDGLIVQRAWDFGDATGCVAPRADDDVLPACDPGVDREGRLVNHRFLRSGFYNVTLSAWDDAGAVTVSTRPFKVANVPPAASVFGPFRTTPDVPVRVVGEGLDRDGRVVAYAWDLDGDGIPEPNVAGPVASARFSKAGSHLVTLFVTDDEGATTRATGVVLVEDADTPDAPPKVVISFPHPHATVRGRVAFHGSAEDDRLVLDVHWLLVAGNATVSPAGGTWARAEGTRTWSFEIDTRGLDNGVYELRVKANDGHADAIAAAPFTVENVAGGIEGLAFTVDEDRPLVEDRVALRGNVGATLGPLTMRARFDEGPWFPVAIEGTRFLLDLDVSREREGLHTLIVRVYSGAERFEERSVAVTIERSPPAVVLATRPHDPAPAFLRLSGLIESKTPPKYLWWKVDEGPWRVASGLATPWSLVVPTVDLAPGVHRVALRAERIDGVHGPILDVPFEVREAAAPPGESDVTESRSSRYVPAPGLEMALAVAVGLIARARAAGSRGVRRKERAPP